MWKTHKIKKQLEKSNLKTKLMILEKIGAKNSKFKIIYQHKKIIRKRDNLL